jgi:hypothetical protein
VTVTRAQYLGTLECYDDSKLEKALRRAYAQRTFEIEHYWKRATFFWGFQAAIFVAFGFVWKEPGGPKQSGFLVLALSSLGILTAIANRRDWHIASLADRRLSDLSGLVLWQRRRG